RSAFRTFIPPFLQPRIPHSTSRTRTAPPGPVLSGAALAEAVECADADERFHFFSQRLDPQAKIGQRRKWTARAFAHNRVFSTVGEAFDQQDWNTDSAPIPHSAFRTPHLANDRKLRAGVVDGGRQEPDVQAMAFEDVDQRTIKAFAVGKNGRHEFSGVMQFEPAGLI